MIKVENKKTIRHVADAAFKTEKMRNLFAVIAITLTTILFCSLFSVFSSMLVCVEESTMRQVGGNAHGGFKYLTAEQYEKLSKHPDIKEISYSVVLATAENKELGKRPTEIRYANDELEAKMMFAMPTTGRLPQAKNELATDTLVLERLGIPAKLGETVTLQYSVGGTAYEDSFTLVGFWDGDIIASASQVWLDREYVEEVLSGHDLTDADAMVGSRNAEVNFAHPWNIEAKLIKVITESGYSVNDIAYGVNWAYAGGASVETGTVLGVVIIVLIIVLCGYLMISNVFMISVAKDVQFYGLLKTVGTTGRQIKALIRRQALLICLVGIPAGLLAGSLIGSVLTPFVLQIMNTNVVKVAVHWWVFLFAAIFALVTVFISIHKAEKMASKVSPIEALRMTDATGSKKKSKPGEKISLWKMAGENVGRNPRKVVLVTLSLAFSLITLNCAYSMANSFDMDKYLDSMVSHDFVIGDVTWFNVYSTYVNQDTLNDEFLEELSSHDGIEALEKIYFSESFCALDEHWNDMAERAAAALGVEGQWRSFMEQEIASKEAMYHVYGIDDAVWDDVTVFQGEIDLEKLYSGDYAVVSPYDTEGILSAYEVGDKIEVFSKTGESKSCEILAIASIPYNISIQHSHPVDINIIIPPDIFLQKVEQKCPMLVTLDVADDKAEEMEHFLEEYCTQQDPNMQYASKATYVAEYENTQRTYKLVGSVVSMVLALIGIANFANTSITSIVARKREFALLESIGMTVRQQRTMLILEGMIYMLLTLAFAGTVGTLIGVYGLKLMLGNGYFTVKFTILPAMVCMPIFLLLAILIPVLSQKYVNGKSVVERLRMAA